MPEPIWMPALRYLAGGQSYGVNVPGVATDALREIVWLQAEVARLETDVTKLSTEVKRLDTLLHRGLGKGDRADEAYKRRHRAMRDFEDGKWAPMQDVIDELCETDDLADEAYERENENA